MRNQRKTRSEKEKPCQYLKSPSNTHHQENQYTATAEDERKALPTFAVQKKVRCRKIASFVKKKTH